MPSAQINVCFVPQTDIAMDTGDLISSLTCVHPLKAGAGNPEWNACWTTLPNRKFDITVQVRLRGVWGHRFCLDMAEHVQGAIDAASIRGAMTNLTPEVERLLGSLRERLNKNSNIDEGPLWNVVAASLNAMLVSVEGGFRGERDLREAMQVLAEYDMCRRRKKAAKSRRDK
jgi:hypothetical protein